MKSKIFTLLLVGLLVLSTANLALGALEECPTCDGAGKIPDPDGGVCTKCDGTGTIMPKIVMVTMSAVQSGDSTVISATFKNMEDVDVTGRVTAIIGTYSASSEEMTFPSLQEIPLEIKVDYNGHYSSLDLVQHVKVTATAAEEITCTLCDGTGIALVVCPNCDGTGYITDSAAIISPTTKAQTKTSGSFDWTLIGTIAGAAVVLIVIGIGLFFFLKRRRPSENKLRKMSSSEFQTWILKMLDGKVASSAEISMGIDGYSRSKEPISIKQSENVGIAAIDNFAMALARNHARGGIIIAFSFANDAIRGKVRARTNYRLDIQLMSVQDLLYMRH
jgi:hypothetical protein